MYKLILIPVENRETDETILAHIRPLAKMTGAGLLLMHVADGWVARNYHELGLRESDEMRADRAYLDQLQRRLQEEGFVVRTVLALGDPADEIIKMSRDEHVDLIAMTTHGHRLISDLLYGSTADKVRHHVSVPVLLLKARASK